MAREITAVGVIGLGTMGAGIVEVFAKAGLTVIGVDGTQELAQRGKGFLEASTGRAVKKGRLSEDDQAAVLSRVTWTDQLGDLKDVDLVIEAVPERMEIKVDIFTKLDEIVREDAVLASNTSSLSITELAAKTKHPARVIGMHFFNPAPVLKLVEVITTLLTDAEITEEVRALAEKLGKKPVIVGDRAGFVANALLISYLARAIRMVELGHVSRDDVDNAMKVGAGFPMGPLTLSDLIGLDVVKEVCEVLFDATRDPALAPPSLLRQMVNAGLLGRKTGRGFYAYDGSEPEAAAAEAPKRPRVALVGEGDVADQLLARFSLNKYDVERIDDPAADLKVLTTVDVAILCGSDEAGCADCGDGDCQRKDENDPTSCDCCGGSAPAAWYADLAEDLAGKTVLAVADEATRWAVGEGKPARHAHVVPIQLHEVTKAGQVLEIGHAAETDPKALSQVRDIAAAIGLTPVVSKDRAGYVVDGLLYPHINDAVKMLDSGYASVADIDTAMTAGCGYPRGLFAILDELGSEDVIEVLDEMYTETGEQGLVPSPLLGEHLVAERPFTS